MTKIISVAAAMVVALSVNTVSAADAALSLRLPADNIALTHDAGAITHFAPANDVSLFESFEYDDKPYAWREETADISWLPEGWTRISNSESDAPINKWYAHPFRVITTLPCYDGNYAMCVLYDSDYKDEWLVSPTIDIEYGQYLTFAWYYVPVYFWVMDSKHVDFENMVYTDRQIAATLKVMITCDGETWTELKDLSEDFADMEFGDLFGLTPSEMSEAKISLAEYAGKSVNIAFRYVGTDGNSMFVDGVCINNGVSKLNAIYNVPLVSQYVGGTVEGEILEKGLQVLPFDTPLTWENCSRNEVEASYTWSYDGLPVLSESVDELVLPFPMPEHSSCDLYPAPSIKAQADGSRGNVYKENVDIMIGGKSEIDGEVYGLLPFDVVECGSTVHTVEPDDFGKRGIPIFGYNEDTDAYWRLYTCGGEEENLPDIPYAYVSGIINGVIPSPQPMVMHGAWLYAIGKVSDEAEFTCAVYSLDEDGAFDRQLASKTIKGSDLKILDTRTSLYYYSLPFVFDEPIVLDQSGTDGDFYAVMITGFHDERVEYFAPVMQYKPNQFEQCFGFYQIEYMYRGQHQVGLSFVANHENDLGEMYCAFAINIDGEYPWLKCENPEISLDSGDYTLSLNSFYPAQDLKVSMADGSPMPDWLKVTPTGRYDTAKMIFSATDDTQGIDADLIVSAPGTQIQVHITKTAGIDDIILDNSAQPVELYDFMGRKINGTSRPGIYIQKNADGSVTKKVL